VDFYKRLGLPNEEKILKGQREHWGANELTEIDSNPW